ncbi:MAG: hypothetical protein H7Z21_16730 [Hymenobacter sp.]|nr:hypothetical protein [Hymenobacter sp.]
MAELLPLLHLPDGCSELFGFPSTHAADVAAVATVAWLVLPHRFNWLRAIVVLWSGTVVFSRV